MAEARERAKNGPPKQGFMARMQERAEAAQKEREQTARGGGVGGSNGAPSRPKGNARPKSSGKKKKKGRS